MKVLRKISAIVTAALTVASMGVVMSTSAATPTTPVSNFSVNENSSDTYWCTGNNYTRPKDNNSSVYVSNASLYNKANVSVYGRYTEWGANHYVGGSGLNTEGLILPYNCERFIRQNINEYGYRYANIVFEAVTNPTNGQWSPDSVGSFPCLN